VKTIFLPLTSSRDGWTHVRSQRLLRFAPDNNIDDNNQTIRCKCGASHPWIGADDPALPKWIDKHGIHMPALPHEPPEHGNLVEEDDAGQTLSMRPALRWPDGRIEVVEQTTESPPPPSSDDLPLDTWEQFHAAGFTDIWYAHPGPEPYEDYQPGGAREKFGPRWHAGVSTGPHHALICVKPCTTHEEAERSLSPGGWSPEEAVQLALDKKRALDEESTP